MAAMPIYEKKNHLKIFSRIPKNFNEEYWYIISGTQGPRMTFELFNGQIRPSCCGNIGRILDDICRYAIAIFSGERIVAHCFILRSPFQKDI